LVFKLTRAGKSERRIEREDHIPRSTVQEILKRDHVMTEAEMYENQSRKGPKRVLSELQENIACGFVLFENQNKRLVTVASLAHFILQAFGVVVQDGYIARLMRRNSFSSKVPKPKDIAHWRKNIEVEIAQFLCQLWSRGCKKEDMVTIDEKSFWTGGAPRCGYSAVGRWVSREVCFARY